MRLKARQHPHVDPPFEIGRGAELRLVFAGKVATISHSTPKVTPFAASSHIIASSVVSGLKRAI